MRRSIVGTAGHIDHGKTSLLKALTGIDADRLPEEKARGITIDIGFAHLEEEGTRIGFVDAPGHEKFVRNMLAGAGGIDALLLVVAADEGVKPQTREHFAIAELLGLTRGVVALTMIDRADAGLSAAATAEVQDLVAGSFLEGAPIIPVSARTGEGIGRLRQTLVELAREEERDRQSRPLRLPIDRAFSISGFGTVVTGSLVTGSIEPEARVQILPSGALARVRRVEVHGHEVPRAVAGERTSVNLAGVELESLSRGQMLTSPHAFVCSNRILVTVRLLASAPTLQTGDRVVFHHFASEQIARVRIFGEGGLEPGGVAPALLTLSRPIGAAVFDRFVLRRPSPASTIGGGEILDVTPTRKLPAEDLRVFVSRDRTSRLVRRIARHPEGRDEAELSVDEALAEGEIRSLLSRPLAEGRIACFAPHFRYLGTERLLEIEAETRALILREMKSRPGARGASRAALSEKVLPRFEPKTVDAILQEMISRKVVEASGDEVRIPGQSALAGSDQKLADRVALLYDEKGLDPPSPGDAARTLNANPKIVEGLISFLVKEKRLVRLPGGFFLSARAARDAASRLRESKKTTVTVAEFKEMFSLTRRMAIPLLEFLDETKVTRRIGDSRQILAK
jgi:selenocysteine-specific elongation factor